MVQITESFSLNAGLPLDSRLTTATVASLLAIPTYKLYDGIMVYVAEAKKYYSYNKNNTYNPTTGYWKEMEIFGFNVASMKVDESYHLIVTLTDGREIDAGYCRGSQGPQGDGFAIIKTYESINDMINDTDPVMEGQMVAVISNIEVDGETRTQAYVYFRFAAQQEQGLNKKGYTFVCDLVQTSVIKGDQGEKGDKGDPGDTPAIIATPFDATDDHNAGYEVTINMVDGNGDITSQTSYNVYDGSSPIITTSTVPGDTAHPEGGTSVSIQNGLNNYNFTLYNGTNGTNGVDGVDGISLANGWMDPDTSHIMLQFTNGTILDIGAIDVEVKDLDFLIEIVEELPAIPEENKIYVITNGSYTGGGSGGGGGGTVSGSGAIFLQGMYTEDDLPEASNFAPGQKVYESTNQLIYTVTDGYEFDEGDYAQVETLYGNLADDKFYIYKGGKMSLFAVSTASKDKDNMLVVKDDYSLYVDPSKAKISTKPGNLLSYDKTTSGKEGLFADDSKLPISSKDGNLLSYDSEDATRGYYASDALLPVSGEANNLFQYLDGEDGKSRGYYVDGNELTTEQEEDIVNSVIAAVWGAPEEDEYTS